LTSLIRSIKFFYLISASSIILNLLAQPLRQKNSAAITDYPWSDGNRVQNTQSKKNP
jgi:hypothetical protein